MLETLKKPGRFCWNGLVTNDVDGAKQFYSELFGWKMEDAVCGEMSLTILSVDGDEIGDIMETPAEAGETPSMWGGYVTVEDVDFSAAKAVKMGGVICVPAQDIPECGRFCVIKDPQGAMLSLFSHRE